MKPLVIEIVTNEARHVQGSKDGRSWDFWTQTAYASTNGPYPQPFEIRLPEGAVGGYQPGLYLAPAGTITVGFKGVNLEFGIALVPLAEGIKALEALASPAAARPRVAA